MIKLHCFVPPPLFSPRPSCLEGSCARGSKAFSQTSVVIEGNRKDSSGSRGGQDDDILNFWQFLKQVSITLFIPIAYHVRGREKSKAFPGRLSEYPPHLVGAAGAGRGAQASSPCCRLQLARLGLHDESKAQGPALDLCRAHGGLPVPVMGPPGTCGFRGHPESGVHSLVCVGNATPLGSSVSLGRRREQALYRAHLQGTATGVQDGPQDMRTDLDPSPPQREGPKPARIPELQICSWSFA